MIIVWHTGAFPSFLYRVRQQFRRQAGDPTSSQDDSHVVVEQTHRLLAEAGRNPDDFWDHIVTATAIHDLDTAVAQSLALKNSMDPPRGLCETVVSLLRELKQTSDASRNRREKELQTRQGPIRMQWESRGPGLMKCLKQLTEIDCPPTCHVVLVEPIQKGHVASVADLAAVEFEAVLTDLHPGLPEVVRLGWGMCRLSPQLRPMPSDREAGIFQDRSLAVLPPLLQAAEEVELATLSAATLESALMSWAIPRTDWPADWTNRQVANRLLDWWNDAQRTGAVWGDSSPRFH